MPQTSHHSSQPRRRPTERISQHVLYGLLGYVVVLFLVFFLFGYDTPYWKNDRMNAPMLTDVLLGAVYGIMALTPAPSVDKDALRKYPTQDIVAVGASIEVDDVFWYEPDREKLERG